MRERYVVLGLARPRADWFRQVGQWATSAVIPAEFVRCVSAEELRARLGSSRPFSAVLIDGDLPALDRDLVVQARRAGCAVLVVAEPHARDWTALGAAAVLSPQLTRDELLEALDAHAEVVGAAAVPSDSPPAEPRPPTGRLVAVTGPGGTGASTVAMALAQGLAADEDASPARRVVRRSSEPSGRCVLLADLCRMADQAMLHDSRVLVPGLQEIVEAHRATVPSSDRLREQTFDVPARGYRLLLGLRRPRHWVMIRPHALEATLDSLQRLADVVVADVDADVEGEAETGSVDVEERNLLARAALARADCVVLVGEPSMKGICAVVRLAGELHGFGVPVERLLVAVNRSPRNPRARAELTASISELLIATVGAAGQVMPSPIHLPTRRVDEALRDGVGLPSPLPTATSRAIDAMMARAGQRLMGPRQERVESIVPGSLATFTSQERPE